jgi:TolA-binding protein
MKEPKRLLSHGATDFERQLLRAVVSERPSALLRSRMQRGLGLVGPLAWASNVKAMFGTAASKVTGGVAVGLVVAGGFAAVQLIPESSVSPSSNAAPTAAPAVEARPLAAPEALPSHPSTDPTAVVAAAAENGGAEPGPEARALPLAASEGQQGHADDSQLREEIALIDAARAALQRGDREQARVSLSSYRERFPDGVLSREANVLRRRADAK